MSTAALDSAVPTRSVIFWWASRSWDRGIATVFTATEAVMLVMAFIIYKIEQVLLDLLIYGIIKP